MNDDTEQAAGHPDLEQARLMAETFPACGTVLQIDPIGHGLINTTFAVSASNGRFVLQRINASVFLDPSLIMDNLVRLQDAAAARALDEAPRLPRFFATEAGRFLARDREGGYWRLLELIADAMTLQKVTLPAQAAEIGRVLGRFHRFGAELPLGDYHVTLPTSHNTLGYRAAFGRALDRAAPREAEILAMADFVSERDTTLGCLEEARVAGVLRKTIIHGDPKRDNLLFDRRGRQALCLIDLDTVQPGLVLHDIGDCLRSCCNRAGSEGAPDEVAFDLELAQALLDGYRREAPSLLTQAERALLFDAARLIPLELGMRFLVDHLQGDTYFRVAYRGQNLLKAQAQFALVKDIERQEASIRRLVD